MTAQKQTLLGSLLLAALVAHLTLMGFPVHEAIMDGQPSGVTPALDCASCPTDVAGSQPGMSGCPAMTMAAPKPQTSPAVGAACLWRLDAAQDAPRLQLGTHPLSVPAAVPRANLALLQRFLN